MGEDLIFNLKVKADYTEAIDGAKDFTSTMEGAEKYLGNITSAIDYIQNDNEADGIRDMFGSRIETLQTIRTTLGTIKTELTDLKTGFSEGLIDDSFVSAAVTRLKGLQRALHSVGSETASFLKKSFNSEEQKSDAIDNLIMSTRNAAVASREMHEIRQMYKSDSNATDGGLLSYITPDELKEISKAMGYLNKEINRINASSKQKQSIDVLSGLVSNTGVFKTALEVAAPGKTFTPEQAATIARYIISQGNSYTSQASVDVAKEMGLRDKNSPNFVVETLPPQIRKAYQTYGSQGSTKDTVLADAASIVSRDSDEAKAFRQLVKEGNRAAINIGLRAGVLNMNRGKIEFGQMTDAQWNAMGGFTAQSIRDAKSGLPFLWADPDDPNEQERMLRRESKSYLQADT